MESLTIDIYPYLSTSFDVKVSGRGKETWFVVHTDDGLIIEGNPTEQERAVIEAMFNNK